MPILRNVNKDFFKTWTPEMAYVLGFFAADGYITISRRGAQFWCLQIADRKLLYSIRKIVGSNHAVGIRKVGNTRSTVYRLQIGSKEMCEDLRILGFAERKTKSLSVPYVSQAYFPDFVRGYFDGDGNVWIGYSHKIRTTYTKILVCFTSASVCFLEHLKKRLKDTIDIEGTIIWVKNKDCFRLQYSVRSSLKLYDFMYNRAVQSLLLKRKKNTFEVYIRSRSSTG